MRVWAAPQPPLHLANETLAGDSATRQPTMWTAIEPRLVTIQYMVNEHRKKVSDSARKTVIGSLVDATIAAVGHESTVQVSDADPSHPGTPVAPWSSYKAAPAEVSQEKGLPLFEMTSDSGLGPGGSGMNPAGNNTHDKAAGRQSARTRWLVSYCRLRPGPSRCGPIDEFR
ncbi:hypothetical protein FBY40_1111 [Microbacterium sp. SLBN-154]|nr:hypothetical protein FBY40_1111 [Microbacterium sp. SLBN-154]